tara:strand:+ start:192 stop:1433 length:1242 start_codon:yes stop_codon:yes gene_type:complete
MSSYNFFERRVSKFLNFSPYLHSKFKKIYQFINYYLNKKNISYELVQECAISDLKIKFDNFFGYYDHSPWSKNMEYLIVNVKEDSGVTLKLFENINGNYQFKIDIVKTPLFNYQQGIRAIWLNDYQLIYNYTKDCQLISGIYNIKNNSVDSYPFPIQEVIQDRMFLCIDYKELDKLNKDYGYNLAKQGYSVLDVDGILGYSNDNKEISFNLSKEYIHKKSMIKESSSDCEINHISACPEGDKIIFIYRSKSFNKCSELYLYDIIQKKLVRLFTGEIVSHFCWKSSIELIVYCGEKIKEQGYYTFNINTKEWTFIRGKIQINGDGHPSISPSKRFLVYDSYPDRSRLIYLNLYDFENDKVIELGKFLSPLKYAGYYRCDLHPRWSPDGNFISIDSAHSGVRKKYIIDVSGIVKK